MTDTLPQHVGIIMDGNRRWATAHGGAASDGHRAGFEALFALLPVVRRLGISHVSIYAFSAENRLRSAEEVGGIMKLLRWVVAHKLPDLKAQGVRVRIIGSKEDLPRMERAALERAERETAACSNLTLGVCFNYGGQQEIVDAVKRIVTADMDPRDITPEHFAQYLYEPDIPPIDLLVRTSGERRLSNFMLWRAAYAELYFTDVLWPDFTETDLQQALAAYAHRQRRFGV